MKSSIPFNHVVETGSTNQDLLDSAAISGPGPTAILTDSQRAGRGRLGRSWHNEPASTDPVQAMLGSVRQDWPSSTDALRLVPFAAGLAVQTACRRWLDDEAALGLKWPNDVVIEKSGSNIHASNDATSNNRTSNNATSNNRTTWFRKVAGILVEATPAPRPGITAVVIGTGINIWPVRQPEDLFRSDAASLSELCSTPPTNVQLFRSVLAEIEAWTERLRSDPTELMDRYRAECWTVGQTVRFDGPGGQQSARAIRVADDGSLLVQTDEGESHSVTSGDVAIAE